MKRTRTTERSWRATVRNAIVRNPDNDWQVHGDCRTRVEAALWSATPNNDAPSDDRNMVIEAIQAVATTTPVEQYIQDIRVPPIILAACPDLAEPIVSSCDIMDVERDTPLTKHRHAVWMQTCTRPEIAHRIATRIVHDAPWRMNNDILRGVVDTLPAAQRHAILDQGWRHGYGSRRPLDPIGLRNDRLIALGHDLDANQRSFIPLIIAGAEPMFVMRFSNKQWAAWENLAQSDPVAAWNAMATPNSTATWKPERVAASLRQVPDDMRNAVIGTYLQWVMEPDRCYHDPGSAPAPAPEQASAWDHVARHRAGRVLAAIGNA